MAEGARLRRRAFRRRLPGPLSVFRAASPRRLEVGDYGAPASPRPLRDRAELGQRAVLWVPGPMPGMNELLAAGNKRRGKWNGYDALKRQWGAIVVAAARALPGFTRARLDFVWREKNKRRDPDNVAGAGRKLILDGLVNGGVLPGDGWAQVAGWTDVFEVSDEPGVRVTIIEVD